MQDTWLIHPEVVLLTVKCIKQVVLPSCNVPLSLQGAADPFKASIAHSRGYDYGKKLRTAKRLLLSSNPNHSRRLIAVHRDLQASLCQCLYCRYLTFQQSKSHQVHQSHQTTLSRLVPAWHLRFLTNGVLSHVYTLLLFW